MKNILDGMKGYLGITGAFSIAILLTLIIFLSLGLNEGSKLQTIGDAIDFAIVKFFFNGSLFGAKAWKWHTIMLLLFGLGHFFTERS